MTNTAIVEKIENNYIIVSTVRKGACGDNCSMCGNCGAEKVYTKAVCCINAEVGDVVTIESNTGYVLLTMFIVFILPLILPIALFLLLMNCGIIISSLGVLFGIAISCLSIYFLSQTDAFIKNITPKIVSIDNKK